MCWGRPRASKNAGLCSGYIGIMENKMEALNQAEESPTCHRCMAPARWTRVQLGAN